MGKVIATVSVTLDGVMQAPGRPDEDTRGGFQHGGWAGPYNDGVMARAMGEEIANQPALLFGRRTYEDFYSVWPHRGPNPFTDVLNRSQKYVASRTLREPLPWANSTLLGRDAGEAVATLKRDLDQDLVILGSGDLVRSLMPHRLVDQFLLLIHPLVLGTGQQLFDSGVPLTPFRLTDSRMTTTGVVIATYELTEGPPAPA
jgi:dihydrofolate reductase